MSDEFIELKGFDEYYKRIDPQYLAPPLRQLFTDSGVAWRNEAAKQAPRDLGGLSRDMSYNVSPLQLPTWVKVGTNSPAGRPQNYGTGLLSTAPDSNRARHFPPPGALQGWATRHGFRDGPGSSIWSTAGGKVAGIIGRRGGLRPTNFFKNATREFKKRVAGLMSHFISRVEARFGK